MRIVILLLALAVATDAHAQSYLEKKDNDAIALITRSLAKLDKAPALFDGTRIPAGANLRDVENLLHALTLGLKTAAGGFGDLSAKGAQRSEVAPLRAKYDELVRYRDALAPVLGKALADADAAARDKRDDHVAAVKTAAAKCAAFRKEIQPDRSELDGLLELAAGQDIFWQDVERGAAFKGTLERLATLCKRPEYADVGKACELASNVRPKDADACTLPPRAGELMKRGVTNLIAHHVKHAGPAQVIAQFEAHKGWLDMDGVLGWQPYFTGKQLRTSLENRIAPLLAQAQMAASDAEPLFAKLAAEYAALEAKVRASAATWELPGAACSGPGCSAARGFVAKWYAGASIKRFHETKPGWHILKNTLGIPTYRERYGYVLVQVKGEPLCQLRMWTLSEPYAGGGRYAAARDVSLGAVRWQACK